MLNWKQIANEGNHFGLKTHAVDRRGSKGKNSFEYTFFLFLKTDSLTLAY